MTEQLWSAVDALTKPATKRVVRAEQAAGELDGLFADYADRKVGWCDVGAYKAATSGHGMVPSLWDQACMALFKTTESTESSGRSPLATRSVADVALMETMHAVRELVAEFFKRDDVAHVPTNDELPAQLRHMASEIIRRNVQIDLWTYRIDQLRRVLERHLQTADHGPKPMRLRARCPRCKCEFVNTLDVDGNEVVARPVLAVYRAQHFRGFECQSCFTAWWPGSDVHALHDEIVADEAERQVSA